MKPQHIEKYWLLAEILLDYLDPGYKLQCSATKVLDEVNEQLVYYGLPSVSKNVLYRIVKSPMSHLHRYYYDSDEQKQEKIRFLLQKHKNGENIMMLAVIEAYPTLESMEAEFETRFAMAESLKVACFHLANRALNRVQAEKQGQKAA